MCKVVECQVQGGSDEIGGWWRARLGKVKFALDLFRPSGSMSTESAGVKSASCETCRLYDELGGAVVLKVVGEGAAVEVGMPHCRVD